MPLAAANANQQVAALQRLINAKKADGKVTAREAQQILAQAEQQNVQGGELALLRQLATDKALVPGARDEFIREVDRVVPAGAPTAQLAAILFRIDPATGRRQLLDVLAHSRNPVKGGPNTFVITGLGRPYIAAITTGQVMSGLVKFLPGASAKDAARMRHALSQQLDALVTPVSHGGLATPGMVATPKGLAFVDDSREPGISAINQNAVMLRALEKVMQLPGKENAPLVKRAHGLADRVARDLRAELDYAYPAKGRLAYSFIMSRGKPQEVLPEDGNHLFTTLWALTSLKTYGKEFQPVVARIQKRFPEIAFAGPEDLSGNHGQIYAPGFEAFLNVAHQIEAKAKVTAHDVARLEKLAQSDGVVSSGESGVIARVKARMKA